MDSQGLAVLAADEDAVLGQADAADILHRWLGEVCGKQLPFGEVCDLFPELVPQAVAAEFVRWLM